MNDIKQKATKVNKLIHSKVVVQFSRWAMERFIDEDQWAKNLDALAKDLLALVRDHRSHNVADITVEREYADVCSACGKVWEPMEDFDSDDKLSVTLICANCEAEVQK